ncbi:MAG: hypothetical protein V4739_08145 [Pseudomonadota bacterium]
MKMTNDLQIKSTLGRMAELLQAGGHPDWGVSLQNLAVLMDDDPARACASIVGMFGGMGSLNDLVLYRNGMPLRQENQELDDLRSKLFALART